MFTTARHMNPVHAIPFYFSGSTLILSTHVHRGLPSGHLPSRFETKTVYLFLFCLPSFLLVQLATNCKIHMLTIWNTLQTIQISRATAVGRIKPYSQQRILTFHASFHYEMQMWNTHATPNGGVILPPPHPTHHNTATAPVTRWTVLNEQHNVQ
jgi:hypothetical protein